MKKKMKPRKENTRNPSENRKKRCTCRIKYMERCALDGVFFGTIMNWHRFEHVDEIEIVIN